MFSIRIQQYSIVNRHKKTSVSSLQINNIREGFNRKNCKNCKFFRCIYSIIIYQSFNIPKFIFVYFPDWGLVKYLDSFSPLLPSGNVVLEKHRETLKVFFSEEDEDCDGMQWLLTGAQTITFRAGHWLKVIICFSVLMLGNTAAEDQQKLREKWCRKYKAKNEIW